MGFLDKLLGKSDDAQVSDLQRAFDKLDLAEAEIQVTKLEQERRGLLLDGTDAQVAAIDERIAAANRQVERVGAAREALTARIAAAQIADDDADRRQRYAAAQRAQQAAARRFLADYPKHARALTDLLRVIAEADALVSAANAALPAGAERLYYTESSVRRGPDRPARVLSEEVVSLWCWSDGNLLQSGHLDAVKPNGDGKTGFWISPHRPPILVALRRFKRITRQEEAAGVSIPSLAASLNLPPLAAGHVPFWSADAAESPGAILAWLDARAGRLGQAFGPEVSFEPTPETILLPLDADTAD